MTSNSEDAISDLARHVTSVRYDDIPDDALQHTKTLILTTLGVSLASTSVVSTCQVLVDLAREFGGKRESTIWGFGDKVPSFMAAFVNATLAHGLNFGDNADEYRGHAGIAVLPAAFAIAERVGGVDGKKFLTACTLGTDVFVRLARSVHWQGSRDWLTYGWMTGQLFAYFAVSTVVGKLLDFDEDQLIRAYGLSYAQAAGSTEQLFGERVDKALYSGYPSHAGVLAALMAERGLTGPRNSLEGRAGLFNVYFQGQYDREALLANLGLEYAGLALGFYPYPGCSSTHPYSKAALDMMEEHGLRAEQITRVTVFIGPVEKDLGLCDPLEVRRRPRNISEAEMSIPFAVAVAIAHGRPEIAHYATGRSDSATLETAARVDYMVGDEYGSIVGSATVRPTIEMELSDGRILRRDEEVRRFGHPLNPMTEQDHLDKFRNCLTYSVRDHSARKVQGLINLLEELEKLTDVTKIVRLISTGRRSQGVSGDTI